MIRVAAFGEASQIANIWNHAIRETTATFTSIEKSVGDVTDLINNRPVFVSASQQRITGFATYGTFRSGPGYAHVAEHSIYMTSNAQGVGKGRRLLTVLMKHAAASGVRILVAGIGSENTGAAAFHAALGFEKVGHLPNVGHKFGRYHDLILMQKNIAALH